MATWLRFDLGLPPPLAMPISLRGTVLVARPGFTILYPYLAMIPQSPSPARLVMLLFVTCCSGQSRVWGRSKIQLACTDSSNNSL
jgi:hypothetical protein